jgi:uncharacterized protein (DUF2147 family)
MYVGVKNILISVMFVVVLSVSVFASTINTPVGLWKTHDDKGKPTGYVRMQEGNGVYTGVIEKGLANDKQEEFCTACKDERKNQKMIGMTVIKNVRAKGDAFEGSEILDPFSGNTYRVKLKLIEAGKRLEVRGFVGYSLFGRTQVWERVENE